MDLENERNKVREYLKRLDYELEARGDNDKWLKFYLGTA